VRGVFSRPRQRRKERPGFSHEKLGIFWRRDESLEEFDHLPDPDVLTQRSSRTSKPSSIIQSRRERVFLNPKLLDLLCEQEKLYVQEIGIFGHFFAICPSRGHMGLRPTDS
jgi:hypothetical protein